MDKYIIFKESETKDEYGNGYPDPFSFDMNDFIFSQKPYEHIITEANILRFDILIETVYRSTEYIDIVLMINNIGHPNLLKSGQSIKLPVLSDIQSFYKRNYK